MSDENVVEEYEEATSSGGIMPTIVYVMYLVAAFTGVPYLVGLIIAYLSRGNADYVSETHYQFQIRTFWIGLLYIVIGAALTPVLIGFAICIFAWIWAIVRSIKGLGYYNNGQPVPEPKTWMW